MDALEGDLDNKSRASSRCLGIRHVQVLLQIFFYVIIFGIELVLPLTIYSMIDSKDKVLPDAPYSFIDEIIQNYLYAYLLALLFGGWFCKKFGFKWPMVALMTVIGIITLTFPMIAKEFSYIGVTFCRVIQGLCAGLMFPMPAEVISRWVPIQERTVLGTAVYASVVLGTVLGEFFGRVWKETNLGWSFAYTQYGLMAIVWALLMAVFGAESPEEYTKGISENELNYIVQNRGGARPKSKLKIPWLQILKSMPFWAIVVAQIGANWMLVVTSINLPLFMDSNYNIYMNSAMVVLIILISWIATFVISGVSQLLISREKTTIEQSRKIFNSIGCLIPAFFFLFLIFISHGDDYLGVTIWVIISVAGVATISGSKLNANDITSNFAPIVYGFAAWLAAVFTILATLALQLQTVDNWPILFGGTVVLLLVTNTFYLMYGSGEEQNWDVYDEIDEEGELSKSSSYTSRAEEKYLLFVRKQ